jgi:hypothetical protein
MFVVLGSRIEAHQRPPRGKTANRMGLSSYDGDHDRECNPWHPGGGLADDDVVIHAPPIITSGIKIKTTFDTSMPAITAAISPIPPRWRTWRTYRRPSHQSVARTWLPKNDAARRELPAVRLLDDSAHGGGSRSCAGPSRRRHAGELRTHRCVAAGTAPPTSDHSDQIAGRGDRRVRNSGSHWRGHQPHVKCGSALDAP